MPNSTFLSGSAVALQSAAFGSVSTLVIIDANVDAVGQLVADIHPDNARVHRLRSNRSGIAQITEILAATPDVDAVHLVSHGEPGVLHLGNEQLSHQTLLHHADRLMLWAEKLQGKDLVLYGCEVGQGARGYLYLQQLRQLTGANIVAASRPVGFQNWDLDVALGEPRSSVIFSEALQESYLGQFIPTVNLSLSTDQLIETEGSLFTINFALSEPPPAGGTIVRLAVSEAAGFNRFDLGFGLQLNGIGGFPTDVSPNGDFSAFQFVLTAQNASVSFPIVSTQADENLNGSGPIEDSASTPEVLTFTATATSGGTIGNGTASVTIYDNPSQVPAANRAPVADDDTYGTPFNTVLTVDPASGVLLGDADPDGDALTAAIAAQPGNGSVTLNNNGSFSYSPNSGFSGSDTFTYTANDGRGGTDSATVTVNVGAAPPTPVVSLTSDITTLVEDEGTEVTFTISLSEPPPAGGLVIGLGTGKAFALGDFDVFPPAPQAVLTNAQLVGGFSDNSGLNLRITAQTATIRLPIFNDEDRTQNGVVTDPTGPLRNDDIGDEQTTFSILAGTGYTVSPTASAVALTLKDTNVVNGAPVADDDAYSTAFNTPLTVTAASGVLNGDTDPNGDTLAAAIATAPTSGTAALNADGSFSYTPNAGFSGNDSFTYSVNDGNGGSDTATVTVTVAPQVIVNVAPVADDDAYSTAFGTPLTVDAATGVLNGDTDANGDALTAAIATAPTSGTAALNADGSFSYTPNAGFSGNDSFTYSVNDGNGGSDTATVTVAVAPEQGGGGGGTTPVVSFSSTPGIISEADGTALVMNFSVAGEIPAEGITVNLQGDAARIMQQFTVAQTRFNAAGEPFYRFDNAFAAATSPNIVGGTLNRFSLEDGDPSESAANEAAAGTGFLSNFSFTITAATASITIPVLNDLLEEPDQTFTYTLAPGAGYTVDPAANSGTFTVTDGVPGGVGPRVGVRATPGTLYESEQTAITLTFTTRGTIPPEGVVVFLEGSPRAIAEFDVNATNPRLPENETVVQGPVVVGGSIVGTNETAGGFFFRINSPTATITVPVFQDDVTEGSETLTFVLRDGEQYQVNPNLSSVTVGIEDTIAPPVVSLVSSTPTLVSESEGSVLELTFATTGTIPATGTTIVLEITDPALLGDQISRPSNQGDNVGITIPGGSRTTITDENGNFVKLLQRIVITEPNAVLRLPVLDDIIQEADASYSIKLVDGEGYSIDAAAANTATFTVTDGPLLANPPVVSIRAMPTALFESEGTEVTLTFNVDGIIPEGGLNIFVDSGVGAAVGEFAINGNARNGIVTGGLVTTGGAVTGTDGDASGFFFRIDQNGATAKVAAFKDDVVEGLETFTYSLVDGEAYNVSSTAGAVTITIDDTNSFADPTPGPGDIVGTSGNDSLAGNGGIFFGLEGDDNIYNNGGESSQYGGAGNDRLHGNRQNDWLSGGDGNDVLYGNGGNDTLLGGNGNDAIYGANGNDTINGGDGDDLIYGNGGNDVLVGGAGNDNIYGSGSAETFDGGSGNDTFWLNGGQDIVILRGGEGTDIVNGFQLGQTKFGLADGLQFSNLSFTQGNGFTSISAGSEQLARVNWTMENQLNSAANFSIA
ncbi:MAG: cadherin-like domain-containing protein [Synechococcales cyanobacterium RM1_1_8]|nr:cadherin-like domain-containing protein [Synechococcales cyanobacterium RM1_1_8]